MPIAPAQGVVQGGVFEVLGLVGDGSHLSG